LEAVFVLLEFPSPSRRIFIGSHSLPPLSGSPYRSFSYIVADGLDDDVAEAEANRLDVLTAPATDILADDFVEILFPDAILPPPPTPSSPESSWPLRPLNFS
jgi:hypothetical protein